MGGKNEKQMGDEMVVGGEEYGWRDEWLAWLGSRKRGERREKRKIKIKYNNNNNNNNNNKK